MRHLDLPPSFHEHFRTSLAWLPLQNLGPSAHEVFLLRHKGSSFCLLLPDLLNSHPSFSLYCPTLSFWHLFPQVHSQWPLPSTLIMRTNAAPEGGETTGSQLCSFPNELHQSRVYARTLGCLLSPRLLITLICLMMPPIQCPEFLWGDNDNLHLCQVLEFATALADHNLMRFSQQSHGGYYCSFTDNETGLSNSVVLSQRWIYLPGNRWQCGGIFGSHILRRQDLLTSTQ